MVFDRFSQRGSLLSVADSKGGGTNLKGKSTQNERGVKPQYFDVLNRSARSEVTFGINIRS